MKEATRDADLAHALALSSVDFKTTLTESGDVVMSSVKSIKYWTDVSNTFILVKKDATAKFMEDNKEALQTVVRNIESAKRSLLVHQSSLFWTCVVHPMQFLETMVDPSSTIRGEDVARVTSQISGKAVGRSLSTLRRFRLG